MIQVIHRAIDVLEILSKNYPNPLTLGEIHGELKLNRGTCANIIKTLVGRGFIKKIDRNTGYVLGEGLVKLMSHNHYQEKLVAIANRYLEILHKQFNESCILCVIQDDKRVVLASRESTHPLQVITPKIKKVYDATTGIVMLSMLSKEEQTAFATKYGFPSELELKNASNKEALFKQLDTIKSQGYFVQTTPTGFSGIAVPLHNKFINAALSIYLPDFRISEPLKKNIIHELKAVSKLILEELMQ